MSRAFFSRILILAVLLLTAAAVESHAQDLPDASSRSGRSRRDDQPLGLKEMMAKQKVERERKEHEEMLERGDEALRLTKQLEMSYEQNNGFSSQDRSRLESLEKVVAKIRKELGGDDDNESDNVNDAKPVDEPRPSTMEEAFDYLKSTTVKLVDELKKTTRFSVSVVAIQTSNSVLKLVRFLRLKK
jgi:hypothetical protein